MFELQADDIEAGFRLYNEAFCSPDHRGAAQQKLNDSSSFLWRTELLGRPRDLGRWSAVADFARAKFPRPGTSISDWHAALAYAATGDEAALESWIQAIEELVQAGRYPSGRIVPEAARGFGAFQRGDYAATINVIVPLLAERERIGGSRAQVDLLEFTVLRAYLASGRQEEARRLLAGRRPGRSLVPVAEVEQVQRQDRDPRTRQLQGTR